MSTIDCPKCECEHEPSGRHDDDAGEMTCKGCGFRFVVEIDYEPEYYTTCVKHEFGPWESTACIYCGNARPEEDRP